MTLANFHTLVRIVFLAALGLQLLVPRDLFRIPAGVAALVLAVLGFVGQ